MTGLDCSRQLAGSGHVAGFAGFGWDSHEPGYQRLLAVQDAKQRFSELIRAVAQDGLQVITRPGEEVAVVDIAEDAG